MEFPDDFFQWHAPFAGEVFMAHAIRPELIVMIGLQNQNHRLGASQAVVRSTCRLSFWLPWIGFHFIGRLGELTDNIANRVGCLARNDNVVARFGMRPPLRTDRTLVTAYQTLARRNRASST